MWGWGVDDSGTIPSQFAKQTGLRTENFAQSAYTAHQNLVWLIQILQDGHRPDVVVFYDGVNEIAAKCLRQHNAHSHVWESKFSNAVYDERPTSFSYYFRGLTQMAAQARRKFFPEPASTNYDCSSNPQKAEEVAENLVKDWQFARRLVEPYGTKFVAILQPVSYFSRTNLSGIAIDPLLGKEYEAVYPRIRAKMSEDADFHDLTAALDVDERLYFDFCHLNGEGNRLIARKIAGLVGAASN